MSYLSLEWYEIGIGTVGREVVVIEGIVLGFWTV